MEERCDGKVHCGDTSDEIDCHVLRVDTSYNKDISPPTLGSQASLSIDVTFVMDTVLKVDEIDEIFYISYNMMVQWYDSRLSYNNLKREEDLNVLTPSQHQSIWTPQLIKHNTKSKLKSTLLGSTIRVLLNDNFTFERADLASSNNVYLFKGSENRLEISQVYDTEFKCQYNMMLYPFDTQECHVDIVLTPVHDNFCQLNVQNFSYTGNLDLRQYFIR